MNYINEDEWKRDFSDILNKLLHEKNVSINKVANAIDADPKTLRNYIDKKSVPSAIMILKLAKYFNVSNDYLISNGKCDTGYSDETIIGLASIIKNFDVSLEKVTDSDNTITLKLNDKIMSTIIKELYLTKQSSNFDDITLSLAKNYGKMKVHNQHLVDYLTFQNIIRYEYIYHDLEDDMMLCVDEAGNDCYAVDAYTSEEIETRTEEWENMNIIEREKWWEDWQIKKELSKSAE